jgi:hypothetical protein
MESQAREQHVNLYLVVIEGRCEYLIQSPRPESGDRDFQIIMVMSPCENQEAPYL